MLNAKSSLITLTGLTDELVEPPSVMAMPIDVPDDSVVLDLRCHCRRHRTS